MKRLEQSVLLAGVLALGLAGCASDTMKTRDTASVSDPERPTDGYGMPPAGAGAGASATSQASTTGTTPAPADPMAASAQAMPAPNSVVTLIEVVPRSEGVATGAIGATGAAGAIGASSDRVYRITLQMDDGSTRVVTQDAAPAFRSGDRVHMSGGEIHRR
ncbi:hypothetical protein [Massilia cavernae]|uniref:Lipoprotein n=1 Tax=Massilia cavernae TaxID=2320864 RepID=A0A418Y785_9BURK|nr:hypothetical protein [Massilia cavernae]RJG25070.1 hypothetical protein D3872_03115 [Massilia cavernae]